MTNQFITGNMREPRRGTKEKRKTIWGKSCRLMMPGLSGRWTSTNTRRTKLGTTRPTSSSPLRSQHWDRRDPAVLLEAPLPSQDLGVLIKGNIILTVCWHKNHCYFQTKIPREKPGELAVPTVSEGGGPGSQSVRGAGQHPQGGGRPGGAECDGQISGHEDQTGAGQHQLLPLEWNRTPLSSIMLLSCK